MGKWQQLGLDGDGAGDGATVALLDRPLPNAQEL